MQKTDGGQGWADVWMRGHFGWEYKGKHKDLKAAYQQLLLLPRGPRQPAAAGRLRHGPLRGPHQLHRHGQADLRASTSAGLAEPANLDVLRKLFTDPESLRPGETAIGITEDASRRYVLGKSPAAPSIGRVFLRLSGTPRRSARDSPAAAAPLSAAISCRIAVELVDPVASVRLRNSAPRATVQVPETPADVDDFTQRGEHEDQACRAAIERASGNGIPTGERSAERLAPASCRRTSPPDHDQVVASLVSRRSL